MKARLFILFTIVASFLTISCDKKELEIFPETLSLNVGESYTLLAYTHNIDSPIVEWGSEHPDIAIVDANGRVTGVKVGSCKIIAICDGEKAVCQVTVVNSDDDTEPDLNAGYQLSNSSITFHKDDQIDFVVTGNAQVQCSVADDFVAKLGMVNTFTNGHTHYTVIGKHVGQTTLRAYNTEFDTTITVTVEPQYELYQEPPVEFGWTKEQVFAAMGTPDVDSASYSTYYSLDPLGYWLISYGNDGVVQGYSILLFTEEENLVDFIEERYEYYLNLSGFEMYMNSYSYSSATKFAAITESNGMQTVMYIPNASSKNFLLGLRKQVLQVNPRQ